MTLSGLVVSLPLLAVIITKGAHWQPISWRARPIGLAEPLQFFHLVALTVLAAGVSATLEGLRLGFGSLLAPVTLLGAGCGVWTAIHLMAGFARERALRQTKVGG